MASATSQRRDAACVRIVYALPSRSYSVELPYREGLTVGEAIQRSGLMERAPELASHKLACAIFGKPVTLQRELAPGERIEILRPLLKDPKESRRENAARARVQARARKS